MKVVVREIQKNSKLHGDRNIVLLVTAVEYVNGKLQVNKLMIIDKDEEERYTILGNYLKSIDYTDCVYYIVDNSQYSLQIEGFYDKPEITNNFNMEIIKQNNALFMKYSVNVPEDYVTYIVDKLAYYEIKCKCIVPTFNNVLGDCSPSTMVLCMENEYTNVYLYINGCLMYNKVIDMGVNEFSDSITGEPNDVYRLEDETLDSFFIRLGADLDYIHKVSDTFNNKLTSILQEFIELTGVPIEQFTLIGNYKNLEIHNILQECMNEKFITLQECTGLNDIPEEVIRVLGANLLASIEMLNGGDNTLTFNTITKIETKRKLNILKLITILILSGAIFGGAYTCYMYKTSKSFLDTYTMMEREELDKLPVTINKDNLLDINYQFIMKDIPRNVLVASIEYIHKDSCFRVKGYCSHEKYLDQFCNRFTKDYKVKRGTTSRLKDNVVYYSIDIIRR